MKKRLTLCMAAMLSLSVVGCSDKKEVVDTMVSNIPTITSSITETVTTTPTIVTPTASPTKAPTPLDRIVAVTDKKYSENFYTEDGILYLTIDTVYPFLSGQSEGIDIINQSLEVKNQEYIEYAKELGEEGAEYAKNEYFTPSSFDLNYTLSYNAGGIINVLFDGYDYTGGAHGMPTLTSEIFDLNTGKSLTLSDFVTVDAGSFHDRVYEEFEKLYHEEPGMFFEGDSLTYMDEGISLDMSFHLEDAGITFYFHPYEVSFYAAGFIKVTIPWSDPIFERLEV